MALAIGDPFLAPIPGHRVSAETDIAALTARLGHGFDDLSELRRALTHASAGNTRSNSYERLEFLGDRVLGLIIAEELLRRFPREAEGDISRRHAKLVSRKSLVQVALDIDLGGFMILSSGEENSGLRQNPAVLADILEAVLGALYKAAGLDAARGFVLHYWEALIQADASPPQDAKTSLQEWAQGRGKPLPSYRLLSRQGSDHAPIFVIAVMVDGVAEVSAEGGSKRAAEQAAAAEMLRRIGAEKEN